MDSEEVKNRAIEKIREPIRAAVNELIEESINNHTNIIDGNLCVKYYIPTQYKWEVKTKEGRKTIDGEEKIYQSVTTECEELEWLAKELRERKFGAVFGHEKGWLSTYCFLQITTK